LIGINEEAYKGHLLLRGCKRRDLVLKGLKFKIVSIAGLVFMVKPGKQIGVETPYVESVIRIASVLMNRDYLEKPFSLIGRFYKVSFSDGREVKDKKLIMFKKYSKKFKIKKE
jgi:hypothetical protein